MTHSRWQSALGRTLFIVNTVALECIAQPPANAHEPLVHPAPMVTGAKPDERKPNPNAHGSGLWMFGVERSVWRPMDAEPSQGYDGVMQFAWMGRDGHFTGRRVAILALGGSTAGFEARLQSIMTLGAGLYTVDRGLAYARLGYELLVAGNARARSSVLAPVLEVGHLWTDPTRTIDLGLRLDIPAFGNFGVNAANSRYLRDLDLGGYAIARYHLLLVDFSLGERQLLADHLAIWRFEGSVCGGATVVLCTRAADYFLPETRRHVTEVSFSAGYGALAAW